MLSCDLCWTKYPNAWDDNFFHDYLNIDLGIYALVFKLNASGYIYDALLDK